MSSVFHRQAKKLLGTFEIPEEFKIWATEWKEKPSKHYPRLPHIPLPPTSPPSLTLGETLVRRSSYRRYEKTQALSLADLSKVLQYTAGTKDRDLTDLYRRYYPSGGALYPLELYIATEGNDEMEAGIYHYHVGTHSLAFLAGQNVFDQLRRALTYDFSKLAPTFIFITCVWEKNFQKYRDFGYPAVMLEAGHLAENLLLAAAAEDIKTCPSAGFLIDEVSAALDIDPFQEAPVHLVLLGKPKV